MGDKVLAGLLDLTIRKKSSRNYLLTEDAQVRLPGSYLVGILLRHHPDNLAYVPEIVDGPAREKLTKSNGTELRIPTLELELLRSELETP